MGLSPQSFWDYTPYELSIASDAYQYKQQEKQQDLLYLAWHIEAFARQKKLPKLDKLLKAVKVKKEKKTGSRDLLKIAEKKGLKVPR